MKTRNIVVKSPTIAPLLLAGVFAVLNASAQSTDTWVGGSGNNFSTLGNWTYSVGSGPVVAGDSLVFDTVGALTPNNNLTGLTLPNITYNSGALGFTLGGNPFTLGTVGTIINVNSSTAQTINNNIALGNVAQTISLLGGNLTLGGVVSGGGNTLTIADGQTLTLSGANTYGGTTLLNAGTTKVGSLTAFGASRVNIANGATMDLNGNNLSVAFINNSAALTGGIIDNVSAGGTVTLTVGSGVGGVNAASGTYTSIDSFSGIIQNTTGTVGLTKVAPAVANQTAGIMATASLLNGPAVLRLMNQNTYTGPTTIKGGILDLNFNQANNGGSAITANIISPSSALVLAGGDLIMEQQTTAATAQTFAGLTLNVGASHIGNYRASSSGGLVLNLNGITRNVGSTVDFQGRPSGSGSNAKLGAADGTDNTTNVNANFTGGSQTILGGYATFSAYVSGGGGSWATCANNTANASKALGSLGTYAAGFVAGGNVDAVIGTSTPATMFINSLRFNTAGAYTVNTAGNITNATGGILETLTVGANAVAINNNILTSGNGQDLIIHQYNTAGAMTIGANIVDNGGPIGLTKSGPGALTLTPNSANTFSGPLTLNAGVTTLGGPNALNGVPAVVFGGMSQTLGGAAPNFIFANGTLNLNGNSVSVASLTASSDSSGTPILQNASATPATLTVNGSSTTAFTGTLQDGTGGGALSLIKNGAGTQTLGGTLSYSGSTTITAGTLALTTVPSATTGYAVNGTLNVTALATNTLTLASLQTLSGSGMVAGNIIVASGAHTRPGATGVTNTITGNLTYNAGAKADFDLNTSATSTPNDQIILSGASSVLVCSNIQVSINLMGATLDVNNDYVLFKLTGGAASIAGSFSTSPLWLGTVPANSASYSVVTDVANKKVVLHYANATAPVVVGAASPATVVRNESTFISVTNTPGSGTITNVYLNLSALGGGTAVPLTLSAVANVYTNTIIIPATAPVGNTNVTANATDTTPLTGVGNIALTILATAEVWNGLGADDNWSSNLNWINGLAPGFVGDALAFDGSTRLTPVMDNSYSVTALTFSNTASSFTISAANGGILTLAGPVINNSPNAQILNVPVAISGTQAVNAAASDVTIGGAITGGSLTKVGNGTLFMTSAANTYTGNTTISNGTVSISQSASIGGGQINLSGGTLASGYAAGTRLTLGNNINVPAGNTGNIVMSTLNRLNGTATGSGVLNINAAGTQDDIGGSWNTYAGQINIFGGGTFRLVINGGGFNGFNAAKVTLTNAFLAVANNSTGNSFQVGALNVDSTATIVGPYAGNFPNFIIGGLNQSDVIAGAIQNSTRITKVGTGNLTIASAPGTATYTGQTIISNGTLTVLGTISSSPVTNYNGATLAGTGTLGAAVDLETGSQITPIVGGYGTMTCSADLTFNGGTNIVYISTTNTSLIAVGGGLNLLGGGVRLVVGDTLTNGVYKLMTYAGTLSGAAANLTVSGLTQPGKAASLSDTTAGEIDLIVSTPSGANLVWASAGAQDNLWNVSSSVNWLNGASLTTFNVGDHVTFNDSGAGNNPVDIRSAVQPSTTLVSGTQAYVFTSTTGTGRLSGSTNSLTVLGTGSLEIDMVNDFGGPTTIGGGSTLTVGNGSAAASLGTGSITNNGSLVFNQTNNLSITNISGVGNLTKNGVNTLTLAGAYGYTGVTAIGSGATLQVGTNGPTGLLLNNITDDGTLIMNISGTVTANKVISGAGAYIKNGTSVTTQNATNTYLGNTYINNGVVKLGTNNVIPDATTTPGSIGWFILDGGATNAGTFDLNGFNETVNLLQGNGGTVLGDITNSVATGTNTLTFGNDFTTTANTYAGLITENTNTPGGKIALVKQGASTNVLTAANSYSAGTIVRGGTLTLGNSLAASTGSITLSNGATLGMIPNGGNAIFVPNSIYTGAGAIVTNTSTSLSSAFTGQFFSGDANSTNVITGFVSLSVAAVKQFQSFAGTVVIDTGSQLRFSSSSLGTNGSDNATFDIEGTLNTRNGTVAGPGISLGALTGSGFLTGAGNAAGAGIYTIGAKGINSTFAGTMQDGGSGNMGIIKVGAGTLTLNGTVTYTGNTTVNDGAVALVEPVSFDNSSTINLGSSTAYIDVSGRADGTLNLGNTKSQTLNGIGNITGNLSCLVNSTVKAGLGNLNVSGAATLAGTNILQLNRTNAITHSEIFATSFAISGPLTVQNVGPALQGGDTFTLFNHPVTGFTATNLPALSAGQYWTNNLAVNGSITLISTVNPNPTNITFTVSGSTLTLSWPADHTGWTLQTQTNSLTTGLGANWIDVPGSTSINSTNITIDPAKPTVFYRLKL